MSGDSENCPNCRRSIEDFLDRTFPREMETRRSARGMDAADHDDGDDDEPGVVVPYVGTDLIAAVAEQAQGENRAGVPYVRSIDEPGMLPDFSSDAQMATLALSLASSSFKTTDISRGIVYVTTPENTWIERTKNDLALVLSQNVLPIATNLARLANDIFDQR